MSKPTAVDRLPELNAHIARLKEESRRLESDRRAVARRATRQLRRARYLRFLHWFRSPARSLIVWPTLVLTVGPFFAAVLTMIILELLFGNRSLALGGFLLAAAGMGGLLALLLYRPSDKVLAIALPEAQTQADLAGTQLKGATDRCAAMDRTLKSLLEERSALVASDNLQRAMLLQRNWKTMQVDEWEDYLVEVCRTLGATVERTSGDGVDMLVRFGNRRVAVAAHADGENINSGSIQKSLAAKRQFGCDACAVIVNRRFTGAAQDYARQNGCAAIGVEEFPDFVLGKIAL